MIAHIVLFKPRAGLTSDQILVFAQQLKKTMAGVETVKRAQVGKRKSLRPEDDREFGDTAYEYSAVIEFADEPGLIEYLNHPLHRELGRLFWENCAKTIVLEVETVDATTDAVVELLVKTPN